MTCLSVRDSAARPLPAAASGALRLTRRRSLRTPLAVPPTTVPLQLVFDEHVDSASVIFRRDPFSAFHATNCFSISSISVPGNAARSALCHDPAMRWVVDDPAITESAASASQMGRFETKWLSWPEIRPPAAPPPIAVRAFAMDAQKPNNGARLSRNPRKTFT